MSAAPATVEAAAPPQNLEAEESVLGAMLLSATAVGTVSELLSAAESLVECRILLRPLAEGAAPWRCRPQPNRRGILRTFP